VLELWFDASKLVGGNAIFIDLGGDLVPFFASTMALKNISDGW
jgi:hypothetical protein